MNRIPENLGLSDRELQVAQAFATGSNYRDISSRFHISPSTVRTHLRNIYKKLGISSKLELHNCLENCLPRSSSLPPRRLGTNQHEKPFVAVLPFENMSDDPKHEVFADGISEDIITGLARFRTLTVMARNSSFHFRKLSMRVKDIAQELGVSHVLEGSVRRQGKHLRVTAKLIDASADNHVWANNYDRSIDDVFYIQNELVASIVCSLTNQLLSEIYLQSQSKHTNSLTAYEYMLHGRQAFRSIDPESILEAQTYLELAVQHDPAFAEAYAWKAWTHMYRYELGWAEDHEEELRLAYEAARFAVDLDPGDAWTSSAMGYVLAYSRKYEQSISFSKRAVELNPNNADVLAQHAGNLAWAGFGEEGIRYSDRSLLLNPIPPHWYYWNRAIVLFAADKYVEALESLLAMDAPPAEVMALSASCHFHLNNLEEAQRLIEAYELKAREEIPTLPNSRKSWINFWTRSYPFKRDGDSERLIGGLFGAGLNRCK